MFGWFINYLLSLRVEDLARAIALKSTEDAPISASLFTIVVERAMDMLTLALMISVAVLFVSGNITLVEVAGIAFLVAAGLLVAIWLLYHYDKAITRLLGKRFNNIADAFVTF